MQMSQASSHSSINQFEIVLSSYLLEAERLALIAESGRFAKLLPRFENYSGYLATINRKKEHKLVHSSSKTGATIDIAKGSPALEALLSCTHMAACSDLFSGSTFPMAGLEREALRLSVSNFFGRLQGAEEHKVVRYFDRLNSADAIRTIQTLKLLGLVKPDSHKRRQLSFGVGNATKDLYSIHLVPVIRHNKPNALSTTPGQESVSFSIEQRRPCDVLLVDNHPDAEQYFQLVNKAWNGQVTGFNKDAYEFLQQLPALINAGRLQPRDLIVSLRFDHLMLPDVDQFFRHLRKVIDDEADLIMSIGAGHTEVEFEGRLRKVAEINSFLKERRLNPVRIKLYRGTSATEKRERPGLGAPQYATYEILYCRLNKRRLK